MPPALWFVGLAVIILQSGVGITLNTCIVVFNVNNIRRGFATIRSNQVHLAIGLMNICILCVLTTQATLWVSGLQILFMKEIYLPINFLNLSMIYSSYWLSSWLCVVYCISIANFTSQLFVWLKRKLSAFLPHLLLLTIAGSVVISVPSFWLIGLDNGEAIFGNSTLAAANGSETVRFNFLYLIFAIFLGCCLPFCLTFLSIILTISSLLQHIQNMKQNDAHFDQSKLQAHFRAVKLMTIHLMLALSFYIAEMFCFTTETFTMTMTKTVIGFFCMLSYPTAQSAIIIRSNSKLRSVFVEMFCLKSLCERPTPDHSNHL